MIQHLFREGYPLQKEGDRITSSVKSSRRPSTINKERMNLAASGMGAIEPEGPRLPRPGPIFPRQVATTPILVSRSSKKNIIRKLHRTKISI